MKCLNCDGTKFETKKVSIRSEYNGEAVDVIVPSFVCAKCKEQQMDSEQMDVLRAATTNAYRKKYKLLTSDEIVGLRNKLGMSQREFATYLGVGEASIKRWETYFSQETAMDEHIRLKCDKSYADENALQVGIKLAGMDEYSGDKEFSEDKFENMTLVLVEKCKSPLFINKALFYADFLHYKKYRKSISGCRYAKLDYGPCPDDYKILFRRMLDKGLLKQGSGYELVAKKDPDLSLFSDEETETLKEVVKLTKSDGGKKLYNLSHAEAAFAKSDMWRPISYKHALKLQIG